MQVNKKMRLLYQNVLGRFRNPPFELTPYYNSTIKHCGFKVCLKESRKACIVPDESLMVFEACLLHNEI